MRRSHRPIVIAARQSPLARAQAQWVGGALARVNGGLKVEYVWVESEGDQRPDEALAGVGGKGLFVRAVEAALLAGRANLAVHSLKDLPAQPVVGEGLVVAALPRRGDVRDCLIAAVEVGSLEELKPGARVGTASPRRAAQLLRRRGDLRIELMRGNIESRLRKVLEDKQFDATLLAAAGLHRAGLGEYARLPLDPQMMLPAAGQGALALQCRADDHVTLTRCLPLNHAATAQAVHAERQVVGALGGDCSSAIAVLAEPVDARGQPDPAAWAFRIRARVLSADGQRIVEAERSAAAKSLDSAVRQIVGDLMAGGAGELLAGS